MTGEGIKQLENRLWKAADDLRANSKLTATEYSFPVLGLIFLRQAYNRYLGAKELIKKDLPVHPTKGKRPISKDDFLTAKAIFLPDNAQWETISNLPENEDIGEYINEAMRSIESEYDSLSGVLPKDYNLFEKDLLHRLIRIFNDEALHDVTGDVFGRIYEYFLNNFSKSGASEGGEFFTPPSLVNLIVMTIEPDSGIVLDPAVGSAGMFVQTSHFLKNQNKDASQQVTFFGQEKADTNTKLAKMNMTVHGLDGTILQGNTFYEDKHDLVGKCDRLMANPPFNVDGVDKSKDSVKNDVRLPFGLPNNDNGNYLWIQYFYSYLNETGRAGFVMASSASDAGHSEKRIREQLVDTGAVDVMVSIGTKFFYTRTLPCSIWFFDKEKANDPKRSDKTLMLDLREVYRKVSSNLHDFTDEQQRNIQAIVGLYRGNNTYIKSCLKDYEVEAKSALKTASDILKIIAEQGDVGIEIKKLDRSKLKEQKRSIGKTVKATITSTKAAIKTDEIKADKKKVTEYKDQIEHLNQLLSDLNISIDGANYFDKEIKWLNERFPDQKYIDVAGLCKVVSKEDIAANDFSLTAGRYVGVASQIDEDFDYEERMGEIKIELQGLNQEAIDLAKTIQENLTELGI